MAGESSPLIERTLLTAGLQRSADQRDAVVHALAAVGGSRSRDEKGKAESMGPRFSWHYSG